MNKLMKLIALVGNVSEVIIASSIVADLLLKIRGKIATKTETVVDEANETQTQVIPDPA